jgi:hypothetical protein
MLSGLENPIPLECKRIHDRDKGGAKLKEHRVRIRTIGC